MNLGVGKRNLINLEKMCFHTIALPNQRSLQIIIKRIPLDVTEEEIKEELTCLGFDPNFIRSFYKSGKKIPIYVISFTNIELAKNIFQLSDLIYLKTKIEAYKPSGPAQCYSCQRFEHSSSRCGHPLSHPR